MINKVNFMRNYFIFWGIRQHVLAFCITQFNEVHKRTCILCIFKTYIIILHKMLLYVQYIKKNISISAISDENMYITVRSVLELLKRK